MSKIIHLDKALANQIAAWEVVERPISIVKELVENSIDAWATYIKTEIKEWWKKEIIITDNWEGIEKEDMPLALEKYSTSKIKSLEDLYNVMTFWFRWEALASISSVSEFCLISKTFSSKFWYSINVSGGDISNIIESPSENWTKITIKNLFYNTPARLTYLKKDKTEFNHILEFLNSIALSYPSIWFEFISDSKEVFKYNSGEDLKTRIYSIYGKDFSENLLPVNFSIPWVEISWFISDPKVSFANRNRQVLFVNHRVVKSPLIYKAISNAYNRFIPHSNFPAYVINLQVDPTQVDVNVHPRKLEVRFANEQAIFSWVYNAIQSKLDSVSLISSKNIETETTNSSFSSSFNPSTSSSSVQYYTGSWTKFKSYSPYKDTSSNPAQVKIWDAIDFSKEVLNIDKTSELGQWISNDLHDTPLWKIIGQTFNSYIIVETSTWLKVLDQHALAERIIYEKLVNFKYESKTQGLLIWESFNLTPIELDILRENKEIFNSMWFDFEIMSWWIVMLNWVPDFVKKEDLKNMFLGVLNDIWEEKFTSSKTLDEVRNKIFAFTACRSAIKFWNKLNLFEMNKLLSDSILDYSATCPHWRPVIFEIWLDELKDKYER